MTKYLSLFADLEVLNLEIYNQLITQTNVEVETIDQLILMLTVRDQIKKWWRQNNLCIKYWKNELEQELKKKRSEINALLFEKKWHEIMTNLTKFNLCENTKYDYEIIQTNIGALLLNTPTIQTKSTIWPQINNVYSMIKSPASYDSVDGVKIMISELKQQMKMLEYEILHKKLDIDMSALVEIIKDQFSQLSNNMIKTNTNSIVMGMLMNLKETLDAFSVDVEEVKINAVQETSKVLNQIKNLNLQFDKLLEQTKINSVEPVDFSELVTVLSDKFLDISKKIESLSDQIYVTRIPKREFEGDENESKRRRM